ncbi:protein kinase [Sorangium cellulosum]|uniref:Protein kinase n=1 Tax=Sorangium cellulosum TaxID=56 RepID=A0A2L0F2R5_SORCE|nr:serine/threonine-protein kinase [Sorangium cellulosum]AUX45827.1 protein kinase [Sorangium cellulosum]
MIGRTLDDRYAIVRLLGQGGMGAVYEARHTGTGRRVAVKVILGQSTDDELLRRFQREARAVGAVESEHIAQVFDTGRDRETGAPYIAMEFLEGEDVQALIDRIGPLPVDLALRVALQACLGLERAHEVGIVHRDIKPANLFLARKQGGQRVLKLLDFGVAKMSDHSLGNGGMTKSGALLGSPLYMSPEQARGSGVVDARSDIWSLGISLYHALTGHLPNGHLTGLGDLVLAICTTPVRWIQELAPWVPPDVAHVVHRTLVIDPAGRTASAAQLAAELRALLPYGEQIAEGMLAPVDAATRASRVSMVPRAASHPSAIPAGTPRPSAVPAGTPRPSAVPAGTPRPSAVPAGVPHVLSGTAPPMSVGLTGRPARPASRPPLALIFAGVLAAAALGGAAVYFAVAGGSPPPEVPADPPRVEAEPPPSAAPPCRPAPRRVDARPLGHGGLRALRGAAAPGAALPGPAEPRVGVRAGQRRRAPARAEAPRAEAAAAPQTSEE